MPEPQAVLTPITEAAIFLVLTVDDADAIRELLPDVSGLRRSVGFRVPEAGLTCVTGIGSRLWDRMFGAPRPASLHPFKPLAGDRHRAPATPGDLLFHIRAGRFDLCFELAQRLVEKIGDAGTVVDEVHGFRSFDLRDVLGFVDGTENPEGGEATDAVLVADDPGFDGGSYVIVQKYVHDLKTWDALPVEQQEAAIGREKLNDVELADQAPDSHVALNQIIGPDGSERPIMRFNMPFGRVGAGEYGTYFIGYAADPDVTEQMLEHMFIGNPPGTTDRILDFSTAVTGGLFFVPSADFIDDPPEPPGSSPDGSLGIGGLRP
jgi:putative iron-dependent peroxidase